MPEKKHHGSEQHGEKEKRVGITGVGPGDGSTGSDSPIIITDGSTHIVSINDDFHPMGLHSNTIFGMQKSNNGTIAIKPDNALVVVQVTFTITLLDVNGKNIKITAPAPAPVAWNGTTATLYNWVITVTTNLDSIARFDMNGGESRLAHPTFKVVSGTIIVGAAGPVNLVSPTHFSIHFR